MTKEEKKAYMVEWRKKNREHLLTYSRERYQTIRKFEKRNKRKNPDARCILCEIKLASTYGGKKRSKYCDSCAVSVSSKVWSLYQRRKYEKKKGYVLTQITFKSLFPEENLSKTQKQESITTKVTTRKYNMETRKIDWI